MSKRHRYKHARQLVAKADMKSQITTHTYIPTIYCTCKIIYKRFLLDISKMSKQSRKFEF